MLRRRLLREREARVAGVPRLVVLGDGIVVPGVVVLLVLGG